MIGTAEKALFWSPRGTKAPEDQNLLKRVLNGYLNVRYLHYYLTANLAPLYVAAFGGRSSCA